MPGNWRQTASVVLFVVKYTELEKLLKIVPVSEVCTYTVGYDRVNSCFVHCFVPALCLEYASEREECDVTGA